MAFCWRLEPMLLPPRTVKPEREQGGPGRPVDPVLKERVARGFARAHDLLQIPEFRQYLESVAYKAFTRLAAPRTEAEERFVREFTSASRLDEVLRAAEEKVAIREKENGENRAEVSFETGVITVYKEFFEQKRREFLAVNKPNTTWEHRDEDQRALSLVHEGLHLMFAGATDQLLGEVASGKEISGKTDDDRRKEGSGRINAALDKALEAALKAQRDREKGGK